MVPIALDFQISPDADAHPRRQSLPPVLAQNPTLKKSQSSDAALRQMVGACLEQILPNAMDVAAGVGTAEHLHQARIGLRRLRSALRVFSSWSTSCEPDWRTRLGALFIQLGSARDRDMLEDALLPELRAVNAPLAEFAPDQQPSLALDALRSPDCTQLFRELIAFSEGSPTCTQIATSKHKGTLQKQAGSRFEHLHRQLVRDANAYPQLSEIKRHRVRKRLKRLRYCVELSSSIFPTKAVNRFLAQVRPAQNILGQYNDLMVADQAFRQILETDPRAWFAVGWIAARRTQVLREAALALEQLARAPTFW